MKATPTLLQTPLTAEGARALRAGEHVLLSGVILTGRDAAHRRLIELLDRGEPLPVALRDAVIFYVGPTPAPPGRPIGSAGPTTAGRMDAYAPRLIAECGLRGMIGKGARSAAVRQACQEHDAVYFGAIGGLGALLGCCVTTAEIVAYPDLGPEAIYRLTVENFPLVVVNDCYGGDAYADGRRQYTQSRPLNGTNTREISRENEK
ncbi:MAG TPA: Fe-S-containing hydro-lyase [Armatimonadota bacterium]|jgi:fumarate hydratase subunit beta